jgi:competence protein ComEC
MKINKREIILLIVCLFTFILAYLTYELSPKEYLRVSYLNVGQGDATLVQTPRGGKILIDGGRDRTVLSELGKQLPVLGKRIDVVVATHDDSDHITGLIDVLERYEVEVLLISIGENENTLNQKLIHTAKKRNVKVFQIEKPTIIKSEDGLIVKILFPVKNMDGANSNDASIVTQFVYGKNRFLGTGDLPLSGEIFLTRKYGEDLKSDVLKLGHHGSDTSTHPKFLELVRPLVAIVSAGKNNSFGHPHRSVVELVEKFGIKIYRTDKDKTIELYSNGINIWGN